MSGSDANIFAHLKRSGVSRECERPSKQLPGSPFLFVNPSPATPPNQTKASCSSLSSNTGATALWSCSRA
jgi:hypothetical protein